MAAAEVLEIITEGEMMAIQDVAMRSRIGDEEVAECNKVAVVEIVSEIGTEEVIVLGIETEVTISGIETGVIILEIETGVIVLGIEIGVIILILDVAMKSRIGEEEVACHRKNFHARMVVDQVTIETLTMVLHHEQTAILLGEVAEACHHLHLLVVILTGTANETIHTPLVQEATVLALQSNANGLNSNYRRELCQLKINLQRMVILHHLETKRMTPLEEQKQRIQPLSYQRWV